MTGTQDRAANYNAKYVATTVGLKIAAMLTGMKSSYAAFANDIEQIEQATITVLNSLGIVAAKCPPYLNYARELWKKTKTEAGSALSTDAQLIKDKYVDHSLDSGSLHRHRARRLRDRRDVERRRRWFQQQSASPSSTPGWSPA